MAARPDRPAFDGPGSHRDRCRLRRKQRRRRGAHRQRPVGIRLGEILPTDRGGQGRRLALHAIPRVPNFPDPINRRFGFYVKSGIDPESPQFKAAYSYCGNRYLGFSHRSSPAERAQWNAQTAKYAYCMRSHGLGNFPDPDGSGVINLPTANFLETAVAQRAQQACKPLDVHAGFVLTLPIR